MTAHSSNSDHTNKEVRIYLAVLGALLFLTIVTVGVSYLHLNLFWAVVVALFVAGIKMTLVVSFFMHLLHERPIIYVTLGLTAIFAISALVLPILTHNDPIPGTIYHQSSADSPRVDLKKGH